MTKVILLVVALLALASATPSFILDEVKSLWTVWKDIHHKTYADAHEEAAKFEVFYHNYAKVYIHNHENHETKMALNKFADLTGDEFKQFVAMGGYKFDKAEQERKIAQNQGFKVDYETLALPVSWDWRTEGAVTPVKNQGQCGSCWAFSATGALEGLHYIKNKTLLSFSEQNLVDCVTADDGCNGGLPSDAFTYTAGNGIQLEADYPYTAKNGKCKFNKAKAVKTNSNQKAVTVNNALALLAATVIQPVSVGVEADQDVWQFYKSGVISKNCGDALDHGVLVVGFGGVGANNAFIVKNSWGSDWGVDGYLQISTNAKANGGAGVCGILSAPVVPTA